MSKIKDYWVYQRRSLDAGEVPWSLYVVKEFTRNHPEETVLDYTLYSDKYPNATKSVSRVGLHFEAVSEYVGAIIKDLETVSIITNEDIFQLSRAILDILMH